MLNRKLLYITIPSYFDLDISLIREVSKIIDVKVVVILTEQSKKSSAFDVSKLEDNIGIIPFRDYRGVQKYNSLVDQDKWYIANVPSNNIRDNLHVSFKLKKFIQDYNPDYVHADTFCKTTTLVLPWIISRKRVFTLHDPIPHNKLGFRDRLVKNLTLRIYNNLIFLSPALVDPFYIQHKNIKGMRLISRLGSYDFLTSYEIGTNKYGDYILFFGRMEKYKGIDDLIKAFRMTEAYKKGMLLILAGKGSISDVPNDPQIIHINRYIDNQALSTLIFHSRIVVLPYKSATQSGVLMSAFAFNKPVVATDVGDFPYTIDDSIGTIVKHEDSFSLSRGIDRLLNANLFLLSENIKERYNSLNGLNSWTIIAKEFIEFYGKL